MFDDCEVALAEQTLIDTKLQIEEYKRDPLPLFRSRERYKTLAIFLGCVCLAEFLIILEYLLTTYRL